MSTIHTKLPISKALEICDVCKRAVGGFANVVHDVVAHQLHDRLLEAESTIKALGANVDEKARWLTDHVNELYSRLTQLFDNQKVLATTPVVDVPLTVTGASDSVAGENAKRTEILNTPE